MSNESRERDTLYVTLADLVEAFEAYVASGEEVGHLPKVQWLFALDKAREALR